MNLLKPLVASMLIAGLVGSPVALANASTQAQLDAMKAKIANMEAIMHTNQSGYFQVPRAWVDRHTTKSGFIYQPRSWIERITISGMANIDGAWGNRSPVTFSNNSSSDIYLRNANLFVDADVSEWTKVHLAFAYEDGGNRFNRNPRTSTLNANSVLDEAYIVLGNFARTPVYARLGRQYVNFGDYQRYRIADTLPQLLTQTRATAATLGFVATNGFNGSVYVFQGSPQFTDNTNFNRVRNFGVSIGMAQTLNNGFCYKVDASYLRNMADVDFINRGLGANGAGDNAYRNQVGGLSLDASLTAQAFDIGLHYVTALQRFNVLDAPYTTVTATGTTVNGAKPAAWGVDAGYSFQTMGHSSRLGIGYQGSTQAGPTTLGPALYGSATSFGLPKTRYLINYTVNVSRNTDVGVEVYNDRDYGIQNLGTGRNALVGVARLAVRFS